MSGFDRSHIDEFTHIYQLKLSPFFTEDSDERLYTLLAHRRALPLVRAV